MKRIALLFFFLYANNSYAISIFENKDAKLEISGNIHLFGLHTSQSRSDNLLKKMEYEVGLDIYYENSINELTKYFFNFSIDQDAAVYGLMALENSKYGRLSFSNYGIIASDLFINSSYIIKGYNGYPHDHVDLNVYQKDELFEILTEYDTVLGYIGDLPTLTYYTPKIYDFTFGLSYNAYSDNDKKNFDFKNLINMAILYEKKINDDLDIKLALIGERGDLNSDEFHNLNAWHIGSLAKYKKFSVTANCGFWNNTGHQRNIVINDVKDRCVKPKKTYYFDTAASIDINDKLASSISYFYSRSAQNIASIEHTNGEAGHVLFHNTSLATDYEVYSDSLKLYAEINRFFMKDNNKLASYKKQNNDGWVYVVGAKSKF